MKPYRFIYWFLVVPKVFDYPFSKINFIAWKFHIPVWSYLVNFLDHQSVVRIAILPVIIFLWRWYVVHSFVFKVRAIFVFLLHLNHFYWQNFFIFPIYNLPKHPSYPQLIYYNLSESNYLIISKHFFVIIVQLSPSQILFIFF